MGWEGDGAEREEESYLLQDRPPGGSLGCHTRLPSPDSPPSPLMLLVAS